MDNSQIIESWLQLIRQNKNHDEGIITKIMFKHNMKNTLMLAVSLGNYYDHLTMEDTQTWLVEHNEHYGITDEDQAASNELWDKLENDLIEDQII